MIEVNPKTKDDEKSLLESSLGGSGGHKSSISSLDELESMKEKKKFDHSSGLSIKSFSTAKDLAKMMEEEGIGMNLKGEDIM